MNSSHIETKRSNTAVCTGERQKQTEGAVDILGQDSMVTLSKHHRDKQQHKHLHLYRSHVKMSVKHLEAGILFYFLYPTD